MRAAGFVTPQASPAIASSNRSVHTCVPRSPPFLVRRWTTTYCDCRLSVRDPSGNRIKLAEACEGYLRARGREYAVGRGIENLKRVDSTLLREWREIWKLATATRSAR